MIRHLAWPVLAAALTLAVTTRAAQAQDARAEARAHFQQGVELYTNGNHAAALEEFQEAYRLAPHPNVRVNMANSYEQLNRPLEALFHYERFMAETAEGGNRAQRAEVRRAIERLRGQIGELTIRVQPEGATVTIDGAESRRAPLMDAVRLPAGRHTITISADGYQTQTREIEVEGGSRPSLRVVLEPGASAPIAQEPVETPPAVGPREDPLGAPQPNASTQGDVMMEPPPADEPSSGGMTIGTPVIVAGAATIALALGGVITGGLALGAESDFEDAVADSNDPMLSPADREAARLDGLDAADRADTLALVSDIFFVGALVGAGVTAWLLISSDEDESAETASARGRLVAAPSVGPEHAGLVVRGAL